MLCGWHILRNGCPMPVLLTRGPVYRYKCAKDFRQCIGKEVIYRSVDNDIATQIKVVEVHSFKCQFENNNH